MSGGGLSRSSLVDVRAQYSAEISSSVAIEREAVSYESGGVELRRQRPAARTSRGTIFLIHGGGYVLGDAKMMDGHAAILADECWADVVYVDYPLAPEHPHPAPVNACYAGLLALNESGPIVISGNSAGGGLAAALMLKLIRDGGPEIAAMELFQPMLDHRTSGPNDDRYTWTAENNQFGWRCLLGESEPSALYSPAMAESLSGFPPTFIAIGGVDLFLAESLDFASRLAIESGQVELRVYPDCINDFPRFFPRSRESLRYNADRLNFLRSHLDGTDD